MSEEPTPEEILQERIAKRSRKLGMLVHSHRLPEKKEATRKDFKRKEKLSMMRKKISERRNGKMP